MNRLLGFLLLFCLLFSGASFAEKPTETALQQGVLLKARDGLPDPRFHNSLVLLVQHDQQGSVGLVVNRPSRLPLADILPEDFGFSVAGETISYG
ncbi:MAG: YqgE/AlgH family protein, partial [Desulfuromonadales bacterium]|nr:YqgE/AlgH family protein [Desulfuromonadales bacterium]